MTRAVSLGCVLAVTLALSACGPRWVKPNAAPGEWEQVNAACQMEGVRQVPAAPAYRLEPGSTYTSTHCDHDHRNCSTYQTVNPPTWQAYDANEPLRDQVISGCYARNGWISKW